MTGGWQSLRSHRDEVVHFVFVMVVGAFVLGIIASLAWRAEISLSTLTRDPAAVGGLPWHTGLLSTAGVLIWGVSSGVAIFVAVAHGGPSRMMLVGCGTLGLTMAVDDALLLHEKALPALFGSGAEYAMYTMYAFAAVLVLTASRNAWFDRGWLLMLGSIALFGVSLLNDLLLHLPTFGEDAVKFLGILGWSAGLLIRAFDVATAPGVQASGSGSVPTSIQRRI